MTDREAQERFQRVKRERDEARAAARAATEDMADWRDRADRYREALERGVDPVTFTTEELRVLLDAARFSKRSLQRLASVAPEEPWAVQHIKHLERACASIELELKQREP